MKYMSQRQSTEPTADLLKQLSKSMFSFQKYKSIVAFGVGGLLCCSSYFGILNLQSSMNISDNIGTLSSTIIYASSIFQGIFLNRLLLHRYDPKWVLVMSEISYAAFCIGNFYPTLYIMIPAALISSFGATMFWSTAPCCIHYIFLDYWEKLDEKSKCNKQLDTEKRVWIGNVYGVLKSCQVFGNLLSFIALFGTKNLDSSLTTNSSLFQDISGCGSNYIQNSSNIENYRRYVPSKTSIYTLTFTLLGILLIGIYIHIACLPELKPKDKEENEMGMLGYFAESLSKICYGYSNINNLLLAPAAFYYGVFISYSYATFTQSFVSCAIGIHQVGLSMTIRGITGCIFSPLSGKIMHKLGILSLLVLCLMIDCTTFAVHLFWHLNPSNSFWVFMLAAALGAMGGLWGPLITAMYLESFKEDTETAVVLGNLATNTGMALGFLLQQTSTVRQFLYFLISLSVVSSLSCIVAEQLIKRERSRIEKELLLK